MLHTKNGRAWYAKSRAWCHDDQSWRGMTRTNSRLIEVNKPGHFYAIHALSTTNIQFEPTKDHLLLVWQQYLYVSYHLRTVALISPVTFDPRGVVDLLSPSLSLTWLRVPGPPPFLCVTLKMWEWAGDEARLNLHSVTITSHDTQLMQYIQYNTLYSHEWSRRNYDDRLLNIT